MAYINSIVLMGNLCTEVELRYSAGKNEPVASFRIAVGREKDVCYIPVVVFGNQATNCERYLAKGSGCAVEGSLAMSQWQDKETGKNRTSYSVIARRITFVGGGNGGGGDRQPRSQQQTAPAPSYSGHKYDRSDIPEDMYPRQPQNAPDVPANGHVPPPPGGYDDIPF